MATKKGPLQTKVQRRALPIFADKEQQLAVIRGWADEDHKKLLLLCDVLGVKDGPMRFYDLALALARKHYVGFQELDPLGKWNDLTRAYLVVEIERLTADKKTTPEHDVRWAARKLATRPEWKAFLVGEGMDAGEPLRVQYQAFKKERWAGTFRDAYKWHVHEDTVVEWDADLREALHDPHGHERL